MLKFWTKPSYSTMPSPSFLHQPITTGQRPVGGDVSFHYPASSKTLLLNLSNFDFALNLWLVLIQMSSP